MQVTQIDLRNPPDNLLRALDDSERRISVGGDGYFTEGQMQEAVALSESLPYGTRVTILGHLNHSHNQVSPPFPISVTTNKNLAQMSGCGMKQFLGYTRTRFEHQNKPTTEVQCATLANLWMKDAAFHGHSVDEDGGLILDSLGEKATAEVQVAEINPKEQRTFEDYFVAGGGNAWYVMGPNLYYVEPSIEPDLGQAWFHIPPGNLHGVFSEDPENPALALLNFQNEGLCLRKDTVHLSGWGWPRNEKVFTFTSRAIQSMIQIAQDQEPDYKLPAVFDLRFKHALRQAS